MARHALRWRPSRAALAVAGTVALVAGLAACGGGGDSGDDTGGGDSGGGLRAATTEAPPTTVAADTAAETEDGPARPGAPGADGVRTVEVDMADIEFSPTAIEVGPSDTVRFVFRNTGELTHEAVLGDESMQEEHEQLMSTGADAHDAPPAGAGAHGHDMAAGEAVSVEPGGSAEIVHTFAAGERLLFGCHVPGHYDAGMRLAVTTR